MNSRPFTLRDPVKPDDFAEIAAVRSAAEPDWPLSTEELSRRDANLDPAHYHTVIVAEKDGRIVGVGNVGHDDFAFEEWRYWGGVRVHPDARNQGIGSAIYDELLRRVGKRGARELRTASSDRSHSTAGRSFLEKRGWRVAWERFESELNTENVDLHAFDDLIQTVEAGRVRLVSLAELSSDPNRNRYLHELDWLLFQDVPLGFDLTRKTLEQWVKEELEDPNLRPALSFVAVDSSVNDPLTGPYVGYSTLGFNEGGGYYFIGMTGVRRSHRGRGMARALKVAAMRALHAAGGGLIRTFNDAPNRAMLQMNEGLGFQRTATIYRYELKLDGQP
ncbi:GNAT family N-acetyltransferase [Deinococcus antarcticus]|uniref:GNAT family N-acetyltransferase n=1 Tax=Deinococcus antarcticus TaxID=1298767 RepID=A0ABV8AA01_9DEIO